jgi:predicted Zn-dependent peptidase
MPAAMSRRWKAGSLVLAFSASVLAAPPAVKPPTTTVKPGPHVDPIAPKLRAQPTLPHERFVLPNGMPVLLHEDHTVPIVVVDVSYDVGSRSESPGRTGFAHLFEHLMFMGTKRAPTKMFDSWMESAGGSNNAWTSEDRTNYYDWGPPSALDLMLWLEADRMRDVGPLMTKEKLDAQRDVVKNERRQSYENRPYGKADLELSELLYPPEHPYHHPVIGSHTDLEAAKVDDVRAFFTKFYDPANAALIVAGDLNPKTLRPLIEKYFASLPTHGKPAAVTAPILAPLAADVRKTETDDVELPRITLAWRSPAHLTQEDAALDVLANVLGQGPASRLHERFVVREKTVQEVSAHQSSRALSSDFEIEIMAKKGTDLAKLEKAVMDEVNKIVAKGIEREELDRAKALVEHSFFQRIESVRERASLLALYETEAHDHEFFQKDLQRYAGATQDSVKTVAAAVFKAPKVVLTVLPGAKAAPEGTK